MRGTHDRHSSPFGASQHPFGPGRPGFGPGPRSRRRRDDFPGSSDVEPGDGGPGRGAPGAPSHDAGAARAADESRGADSRGADSGGGDPRDPGADPGSGAAGAPDPRSTRGGRGGPGGGAFGPGGPGFGFGGRPSGFGPGGDPGRRGHHGRTFQERGSGRARGGRGPGRRAGRGDVRAAILLLLAEQPRHGYQLIQEIAARSDGRWQPSPGAVYPALNLLEDEGLVVTATESGRRLATLTDAGRAYVEEHAAELGTPWDDAATRPADPIRTLRDAVGTLVSVVHQVGRTGSDEQVVRAVAVLERARRDLYLVLAGEDPANRDTTPGAS